MPLEARNYKELKRWSSVQQKTEIWDFAKVVCLGFLFPFFMRFAALMFLIVSRNDIQVSSSFHDISTMFSVTSCQKMTKDIFTSGIQLKETALSSIISLGWKDCFNTAHLTGAIWQSYWEPIESWYELHQFLVVALHVVFDGIISFRLIQPLPKRQKLLPP